MLDDQISRINDMHYFQIGTKVVAWDDRFQTERTVIGIRGNYKDDHIRLDEPNSPWMIAGHYRRA